ncbi:hypothetical protein BMS3Abin07_02378 [bacterium BMS3Abin07]|nr:hypothetical protein BMS3Abin07_02378 [bacterium BMS3Abin07]GBE31403.1 hypothetical protein BMS3Bbin05_00303 [bacterium BMS3Bbin05]HDL20219.1 exopolyphosphatase [Nitrospirota bacterium]HDO22375.1 exopolyphosphatase [Nitrospirota bacterium]HDZ87045.1 exopolyphosphatase [Nitrospirota bacterium]
MRLVTRGDLDGVTSSVLLITMEHIDSIELIHPQDITDDKFEIKENDIMANLPYHPKATMWFDHHELTENNLKPPENFTGNHSIAPSVARIIYGYYDSEQLRRYEYLVSETDRFDSARLDMDDIIDPRRVILLGFTIDSRSGLGGFREYFEKLVSWLKTMTIEEVLLQPAVRERIKILKEQNANFLSILKKNSRKDGNVLITDFRQLDKIPVGNRFLVYTLYPDTNVSVRIQWGPEKKFAAVTLGHNIFNRTSNAKCGQICSRYGGGGHNGAGACPVNPEDAERQISEIIDLLKKAG